MSTDFQKNISDEFMQLMSLLNQKITNPMEMMKRLPIPPSHVKVIFYLKHNGPSVISQVAKDLSISKPNMTPIIDKLIMENYVRRYDDPCDRRIIKIEATNKASELLEKYKQHLKETICSKISSLSDRDLSELGALIGKMESIIEKVR